MLNHGVLVGERWNDETARLAYEAAGGRLASTGAQVEGAQTGETAMAFAEAVPGVVVGKPLEGLKVDKVAGASWTSDAFNAALDVARQEASVVQ